MEVAGYFKLMLLGTYTIIVFECRTHSSLKWPPLMIQINLLALDTDCVQSRNYGKWVKCPTWHFKLGHFKNGLGQIIMIIKLSWSESFSISYYVAFWFSLLAEVSFLLCSMDLWVQEKKPLPLVETLFDSKFRCDAWTSTGLFKTGHVSWYVWWLWLGCAVSLAFFQSFRCC